MMQRIVVRVEGRPSGGFGDPEGSGFSPFFHGVGGVKGVGLVLQLCVPNFFIR